MNVPVKLLAVTLMMVLVQCQNYEDRLFFRQEESNEGSETLLVMTWMSCGNKICTKCDFYSDKGEINEILESSNAPHILTISEDDMNNLLDDCQNIDNPVELGTSKNSSEDQEAGRVTTMASNSETTTPPSEGMPIIFPGTKWCGAGDKAKNYDDLGLHQDTDRCCRAHDLCNDTLLSGESRNGLNNNSPFTKLSCQCDDIFYDCLDRINSVISNTVGNMYFNILRTECYIEEIPTTNECKKYISRLKLKCLEYETIQAGPKVYQWVPAKKYKKIPLPGPLTINLPF